MARTSSRNTSTVADKWEDVKQAAREKQTAFEDYVRDHPTKSVVYSALAGAAVATIIYAMSHRGQGKV